MREEKRTAHLCRGAITGATGSNRRRKNNLRRCEVSETGSVDLTSLSLPLDAQRHTRDEHNVFSFIPYPNHELALFSTWQIIFHNSA